jgi:PAS domain S-box-containing protein
VQGLFENAFSNAPIGMALIDMDGRWLQVNNALCRITGYAESELKAKTLRSLIHPDDIDPDVSLSRQLLDGKVPSYQAEKRCIHAWGHFVWVTMTVSLVRDRKGRALYQIVQLQDISARKELAGRLEDLVDHDFLTGLFNRRHFEQELAQEVERASRYGSPGAVLLIDVDNFKNVNDTFGHTVGDDLLKRIAESLKHRMRGASPYLVVPESQREYSFITCIAPLHLHVWASTLPSQRREQNARSRTACRKPFPSAEPDLIGPSGR